MFLSSEVQIVTENSNKRFGGYESLLTDCYLAFLPINTRKEFESWCQKLAMMRQVTKIGIAKPWRLTIILAMGRAIRPAYEGIETFLNFRSMLPPVILGRAIRPAYEGIETRFRGRIVTSYVPRCRAIRPAYEGIETAQPAAACCCARKCRAIRPAYEGIETSCYTSQLMKQAIRSRAIRPAYEGIETGRISRHTFLHSEGRAIRPAYEGIET